MIKKELSPKQQAVEMIREKNNFLIVSHVNPDGDAISSALSLKLALEKMGKKADAAIPEEISENYQFLPSIKKILRDKNINKDLVINLKNKVGKISYDKKDDGTIDLIITPAHGDIRESDISLEFGKNDYEVIIFLDSPYPDRANEFYALNKELLKNLPSINIDHHPTNENFGTINIVDPIATATCEIVFSLIEALDKNLIDEEISTLILTGIISDTNRFQNANTTPKSLTISAQLIASGARISDIAKNIFRTKPVSTLKLWGKILSAIKEDKEDKIVWSSISAKEVAEIGASYTQAEGVMDELLSSAPGANVVLMLIERFPGIVTGSLRTLSDTIEVDKLAVSLGGGGHKKAAGFKMEGINIADAEKLVIPKIKTFLRNRTNTPVTSVPEGFQKDETIFKEKIVSEPAVLPQKNIQPDEENLYAPSLSDIELESPDIVEEKTSILRKLVDEKKKRQVESMDFAKMEAELKREGGAQPEHGSAPDVDYDEDYE